MKKLIPIVLVILFTMTGCEESDIDANALAVSTSNDELIIVNKSFTDLYFTVFPSKIVPLIDWFPIISKNNKISSFETIKIPLDEVTDYHGMVPSNEALTIFYWRAVVKDGGLVSGEINSLDFTP